MDTKTFAQKIKTKYPQYQGVDDATLVTKIVEKYPQYKAQVNDLPAGEAKPTFQEAGQETTGDLKQIGTDIKNSYLKRQANVDASKDAQVKGQQGGISTAFQTLGQGAGLVADTVGSVVKGVAKAFLPQKNENKVKENLATLVNNPVVKPIVNSDPVQSLVKKYEDLKVTHPELARNIDATLGLGEFALNYAGLEGAGAAGNAVKEAGGQAFKSGAEVLANTAGKVSSNIDNVIIPTKNALGGVIEKTGKKIQMGVIKPSTRDIKDGFKIENVSKYDVGGSLSETVAKSHVKMNDLTNQLTEKLKGSTEKINLQETFDETAKRLLGDKTKTFGDNSAIDRVLKQLKTEIKTASSTGETDLVQATNIKRGAGTKGAWAYNRPEADASAIEKVYSEFYHVIKNKIEKAAPSGVKEINKQISELIPINNAALRRMTVEERNNILNITDTIGLTSAMFDPKALLLVGANKALKSGSVGDFLVKAGNRIKK